MGNTRPRKRSPRTVLPGALLLLPLCATFLALRPAPPAEVRGVRVRAWPPHHEEAIRRHLSPWTRRARGQPLATLLAGASAEIRRTVPGLRTSSVRMGPDGILMVELAVHPPAFLVREPGRRDTVYGTHLGPLGSPWKGMPQVPTAEFLTKLPSKTAYLSHLRALESHLQRLPQGAVVLDGALIDPAGGTVTLTVRPPALGWASLQVVAQFPGHDDQIAKLPRLLDALSQGAGGKRLTSLDLTFPRGARASWET